MKMQHLTEEQIYAYVLDKQSLSSGESTHLETCTRCRTEAQNIAALVRDFDVARRSEPAEGVLTKYHELFQDHGPERSSALESAWNWVIASLISDSRLQPLAAATRSVRADTYRLLYNAPQADIELFIEGEGQARRLQGDVMVLESGSGGDAEPIAGHYLVQLQDHNTLGILFEATTDEEGRFQFENVPTGLFRLLVTIPGEDLLEIGELNIT